MIYAHHSNSVIWVQISNVDTLVKEVGGASDYMGVLTHTLIAESAVAYEVGHSFISPHRTGKFLHNMYFSIANLLAAARDWRNLDDDVANMPFHLMNEDFPIAVYRIRRQREGITLLVGFATEAEYTRIRPLNIGVLDVFQNIISPSGSAIQTCKDTIKFNDILSASMLPVTEQNIDAMFAVYRTIIGQLFAQTHYESEWETTYHPHVLNTIRGLQANNPPIFRSIVEVVVNHLAQPIPLSTGGFDLSTPAAKAFMSQQKHLLTNILEDFPNNKSIIQKILERNLSDGNEAPEETYRNMWVL